MHTISIYSDAFRRVASGERVQLSVVMHPVAVGESVRFEEVDYATERCTGMAEVAVIQSVERTGDYLRVVVSK